MMRNPTLCRFVLLTGIFLLGPNLLWPTPGLSQDPRLTVDRIFSQPPITGISPSQPAWAPNSSQLAFLWKDANSNRREIWLVRSDGTGRRQRTRANAESGGVSQFVWTPDSNALILSRGGHLWRSNLNTSDEICLTRESGSRSSLAISPDGRFLSFLEQGDLWLLELGSKELTRATKVGVPPISKVPLGRYNRPDVEIGPYVWGGPTYRWSPDSKTVAVHYVDRRKMRTVAFPYYLNEQTPVNELRRGYPGDDNEFRSVGFYDVETTKLSLLDLPSPTRTRVVDFSWSTDGRLLIDRESDTAVDRWLHQVEPTNKKLEQLWHDQRETRVYTSIGSAWHPDGKRVLFLSDIEDRYGLYLLERGQSPKRLTNKKFDVTGTPIVTAGKIFFPSNEPSPYEQNLFQAPANGGEVTRIKTPAGTNRPYPSPDGTRVAILNNSDVSPTELYLTGADGKSAEQRITDSRTPEFKNQDWVKARYATCPSRIDDFTLHMRVMEPSNLDRTKRHPVIIGPAYSNTVRNRWSGRYSLIQQLLVERGYIVVQVDVRGSTGYGRQFREGFLMDFGGKDIEDLHSAVEHLAKLPYVDSKRIGIWGSSYGGTLTLYSLFKKPGLYKAGVACAAAVDPYFFGTDDVAIVRRPQSHPDAFARGAAQYAGNLQDHLLMIHGIQDDIVPFKTTVRLAEELMRKGKDFDFAFAPGPRTPGHENHITLVIYSTNSSSILTAT